MFGVLDDDNSGCVDVDELTAFVWGSCPTELAEPDEDGVEELAEQDASSITIGETDSTQNQTEQHPASPISCDSTSSTAEPVPDEQLFGLELTPTVERHIIKIQAAIRGKAARSPPGMPAHSSDEDDQDTTIDRVEAAAVAIQARVRGRLVRRVAATERLTLAKHNQQLAPDANVELSDDTDVAEWLVAQNAEDLVDAVKHDFGIMTLRDLIAVVQEPQDWTIFIPDDEARGMSLWASMQAANAPGLPTDNDRSDRS